MVDFDQHLTRGQFIRLGVTMAAGLVAAACEPKMPPWQAAWPASLERRGDIVRADMVALDMNRSFELVNFQNLVEPQRYALNFNGPRVGFINRYSDLMNGLLIAHTEKGEFVVKITPSEHELKDAYKYDPYPALAIIRLDANRIHGEVDETIGTPQATFEWDLSRFIDHSWASAQIWGGDGFKIEKYTTPKGYLLKDGAITLATIRGKADHLSTLLKK